MRLKDDGGVTAKIIDLGLAKVVNEPSLQTAISTAGGFVGTPEFASPEQFGRLALDTTLAKNPQSVKSTPPLNQ